MLIVTVYNIYISYHTYYGYINFTNNIKNDYHLKTYSNLIEKIDDYKILVNKNDNLYYLKNIFTNVNYNKYLMNEEIFIIYINSYYLLIPSYLIGYFTDYPIYNYKFIQINDIKNENECLKEINLYKIIF